IVHLPAPAGRDEAGGGSLLDDRRALDDVARRQRLALQVEVAIGGTSPPRPLPYEGRGNFLPLPAPGRGLGGEVRPPEPRWRGRLEPEVDDLRDLARRAVAVALGVDELEPLRQVRSAVDRVASGAHLSRPLAPGPRPL